MPPPSLNRMYRMGKGSLYKTAECKNWIADCHYSIRDQIGSWVCCPRPVSVTVTIQPKDGRLRDIDNYLKPLFDMLESNRLIHNDRQIYELHLVRLEPDYLAHRLTVHIQHYSPSEP